MTMADGVLRQFTVRKLVKDAPADVSACLRVEQSDRRSVRRGRSLPARFDEQRLDHAVRRHVGAPQLAGHTQTRNRDEERGPQ
jgi:hypothetical protein